MSEYKSKTSRKIIELMRKSKPEFWTWKDPWSQTDFLLRAFDAMRSVAIGYGIKFKPSEISLSCRNAEEVDQEFEERMKADY